MRHAGLTALVSSTSSMRSYSFRASSSFPAASFRMPWSTWTRGAFGNRSSKRVIQSWKNKRQEMAENDQVERLCDRSDKYPHTSASPSLPASRAALASCSRKAQSKDRLSASLQPSFAKRIESDETEGAHSRLLASSAHPHCWRTSSPSSPKLAEKRARDALGVSQAF